MKASSTLVKNQPKNPLVAKSKIRKDSLIESNIYFSKSLSDDEITRRSLIGSCTHILWLAQNMGGDNKSFLAAYRSESLIQQYVGYEENSSFRSSCYSVAQIISRTKELLSATLKLDLPQNDFIANADDSQLIFKNVGKWLVVKCKSDLELGAPLTLYGVIIATDCEIPQNIKLLDGQVIASAHAKNGACAYAESDGAVAYATSPSSKAYATASGAVARATFQGAVAFATILGARSYASTSGALACARALGAEANANVVGAVAYAMVIGSVARSTTNFGTVYPYIFKLQNEVIKNKLLQFIEANKLTDKNKITKLLVKLNQFKKNRSITDANIQMTIPERSPIDLSPISNTLSCYLKDSYSALNVAKDGIYILKSQNARPQFWLVMDENEPEELVPKTNSGIENTKLVLGAQLDLDELIKMFKNSCISVANTTQYCAIKTGNSRTKPDISIYEIIKLAELIQTINSDFPVNPFSKRPLKISEILIGEKFIDYLNKASYVLGSSLTS